MLDELRYITSSEPYISAGGMRVKEISIMPWNTPDAKFVFEIWTSDNEDSASQIWEVTGLNLAQTDGIPQAVVARAQLKLYTDHPVLWHLDDIVFFSVTGKARNIPALMGELFIEHGKACGNWVEFHRLYHSLPETLVTLRENQLAIPSRLKDVCFKVLERHGVQCRINDIDKKEREYRVLFFSSAYNWPDEENFKQSYIIAELFTARTII